MFDTTSLVSWSILCVKVYEFLKPYPRHLSRSFVFSQPKIKFVSASDDLIIALSAGHPEAFFRRPSLASNHLL